MCVHEFRSSFICFRAIAVGFCIVSLMFGYNFIAVDFRLASARPVFRHFHSLTIRSAFFSSAFFLMTYNRLNGFNIHWLLSLHLYNTMALATKLHIHHQCPPIIIIAQTWTIFYCEHIYRCVYFYALFSILIRFETCFGFYFILFLPAFDVADSMQNLCMHFDLANRIREKRSEREREKKNAPSKMINDLLLALNS